jgi:hypothetical protein
VVPSLSPSTVRSKRCRLATLLVPAACLAAEEKLRQEVERLMATLLERFARRSGIDRAMRCGRPADATQA